jgi:hypothetical protein
MQLLYCDFYTYPLFSVLAAFYIVLINWWVDCNPWLLPTRPWKQETQGEPPTMRWHATALPSRFDGQIAAVPITLLSREEDVSIPRLSHHASASSRRTLISKTAMRTSTVPTKLPDHHHCVSIASPSETIRLSTTVVTAPRAPQSSTRALTPRAEEPEVGATAVEDVHTKFLVCAGRALNAESPRNNNNDEDDDGEVSLSTPPGHPSVSSSHETPRSQRGLQRSDSELELIINELREKIARQHRSSQSPQTDDDAGGNQHSRKHLKSAVEKMSAASTMPSSSMAGKQLRHQASASHEIAAMLVREGSEAMVTPAVLAISASRPILTSANNAAIPSRSFVSKEGTTAPPVGTSDQPELVNGFQIRAYGAGIEPPTQPRSASFTRSTLLEQRIPTSHSTSSSVPSKETPTHTRLERPSKTRVRTLEDLDVELDCSNEGDSDRGDLSPVGPWVLDHEAFSPLASSRSTCSLVISSSTGDLARSPPKISELSPRSRLLWLSDCTSGTGWGSAPTRVMVMLRPGSQQQPVLSTSRPVSAMELRRRPSKATGLGTPGKLRAASAKSAHVSVPRRPSVDMSNPLDSASYKAQGAKRVAHRPRSGSSSCSGSTGSSISSSNTASTRVLIPHRASFRA